MAVKFIKRAEVERAEIENLQKSAGVCSEIAELLCERGVNTPEKVQKFFYPKLHDMQSPFEINGVREAVERINRARENNDRILIYGDYDCDGICSVAMFLKFFAATNDFVSFYIPNRNEEGYGISVSALEAQIKSFAPDLVISVDCGITAVKEVEYVKSKGIDVIITDHHEPQNEIPDTIVVDPKTQEGIFRDYCGAGVVFKIIEAAAGIAEAMRYIGIAATATIADIVPLVSDNRVIVHYGLEAINKPDADIVYRVWKKALNLQEVKASDVMFQVAPRLNAAGRIDDASKVIGMYLTESPTEIMRMFEELTSDNNERKAICDKMIVEAREKLLSYDLTKNRIIVLKDKGWNAGTVGIAAAKIAEEFSRPTILLAEKEDGALRGSARSIPGLNLFECLSHFTKYFQSFGGHVSAVGLSLMTEDFDNFVAEVNEFALKNYENGLFLPKILYDVEISEDRLTLDFAESLTLFEPTGYGNSQPVFKLKDKNRLFFKSISTTNHIKAESGSFELVGFNMGKRLGLYTGGTETTFTASVKEFRGRRYVGGIIKADILGDEISYNKENLAYLMLMQTAHGENTPPKEFLPFDEKKFKPRDSVFGNAFICTSVETFEKAVKIADEKGFPITKNIRWTSVKNPYNRIVLLPDDDFPFDYYDNIVFLDKPSSTGYAAYLMNKFPRAEFYLYENAKETEIADLPNVSDADLRFIYVKIKDYLCYHKERNVFDLYFALKSYNFKFSPPAAYLAFSVFKELGLLTADEAGLLKIGGNKCNLSDSYIYRKYIKHT